MKKLVFLFTLMTGSAFALPHMDLEMTSEEYRALLKTLPVQKNLKADDPAITRGIALGERLSQWITTINNGRTPDGAIRLTSEATRRGIPIDQPSIYSPKTIKADTENVLSELPHAMKTVILGSGELPATTGMDDETFILHARKLDKIYQSSVRYKSLDFYRASYIRAASQDVRGYYYLTKNKITEAELRDLSKYPPEQLSVIKDALVKICMNNNQTESTCSKKLAKELEKNNVVPFYRQYLKKAQVNWNNFFNIPRYAVRSDLAWGDNVSTIPFNTPEHERFVPYLRDNIQDEFRWGSWGLKMVFGNFPDGARLMFVPGQVPHVNELGGNEIVMDSNQPIEEYESQWTIRHEFGHILGLPDCYHEFYDTKLDAYVNYQLDITDLMCSRAGNMNERIYLELKRAYTK